jgi:hypothetical protein
VEIFTALAPGRTEVSTSAAIAHDLARQLPGTDERSTPKGVAVHGGLALWLVPSTDDGRTRRLLVLAPESADPVLSDLVWTRGQPVLGTLTRYHLHYFKLAYQVRVWRAADLVELRNRSEALLHEALSTVDTATAHQARLRELQRRLTTLQADEHGLAVTATNVEIMHRTVTIAVANMMTHRRRLIDSADGDPFARDATQAIWFEQQLDNDLAYLRLTRDRVHHSAALIDRELRTRSERLRDASRVRQERFALLQTAIISVVIMCLTAIQALGYQIPLPDPAKPAAIATLGAITLWLSTIAIALAQTHSSATVGWLQDITVGLVAASGAWLVGSLVSHSVTGGAAASVVTMTISGLTFAVTTALAIALRRVRRFRRDGRASTAVDRAGPAGSLVAVPGSIDRQERQEA